MVVYLIRTTWNVLIKMRALQVSYDLEAAKRRFLRVQHTRHTFSTDLARKTELAQSLKGTLGKLTVKVQEQAAKKKEQAETQKALSKLRERLVGIGNELGEIGTALDALTAESLTQETEFTEANRTLEGYDQELREAAADQDKLEVYIPELRSFSRTL